MPGMDRIHNGLQAVKVQNEWWLGNHEIHRCTVEEPYPHGDQFIGYFTYAMIPEYTGQRIRIKESGLYPPQDGQIVKGEFSTPCSD